MNAFEIRIIESDCVYMYNIHNDIPQSNASYSYIHIYVHIIFDSRGTKYAQNVLRFIEQAKYTKNERSSHKWRVIE